MSIRSIFHIFSALETLFRLIKKNPFNPSHKREKGLRKWQNAKTRSVHEKPVDPLEESQPAVTQWGKSSGVKHHLFNRGHPRNKNADTHSKN